MVCSAGVALQVVQCAAVLRWRRGQVKVRVGHDLGAATPGLPLAW